MLIADSPPSDFGFEIYLDLIICLLMLYRLCSYLILHTHS